MSGWIAAKLSRTAATGAAAVAIVAALSAWGGTLGLVFGVPTALWVGYFLARAAWHAGAFHAFREAAATANGDLARSQKLLEALGDLRVQMAALEASMERERAFWQEKSGRLDGALEHLSEAAGVFCRRSSGMPVDPRAWFEVNVAVARARKTLEIVRDGET